MTDKERKFAEFLVTLHLAYCILKIQYVTRLAKLLNPTNRKRQNKRRG